MEDGEVVSEIQLGKFRNDDLKAREEKLLKWLAVLGFLKTKTPIEYRSFFLCLKVRKRYIIIFLTINLWRGINEN